MCWCYFLCYCVILLVVLPANIILCGDVRAGCYLFIYLGIIVIDVTLYEFTEFTEFTEAVNETTLTA